MFHSVSGRFHVMVVCFMRSASSMSGCAFSVRSTPRYFACFTRFICWLFVKVGIRRPV